MSPPSSPGQGLPTKSPMGAWDWALLEPRALLERAVFVIINGMVETSMLTLRTSVMESGPLAPIIP